jgi:hypothetical protein
VTDTQTPIVVHCAGRTRGIVGTQILRDLGVPNPVLALKNGTQGWALVGLALERGSDRRVPLAPPEAARSAAAEAARRAGVPKPTVHAAQDWLDNGRRTTRTQRLGTSRSASVSSRPYGAWTAKKGWPSP